MAESMNLFNAFVEFLEKQEETDVVFKLTGSKGSEEYGAHKLILSAASPVFKRMFSIREKDGKVIEITSLDAELFKTFLKVIYSSSLTEDAKDPETIVGLYKLSDSYKTLDVTFVLSKHMNEHWSFENLIIFANAAWIYGDDQLKKTYEKVFTKHATQILGAESFLIAETAVINAFYSLDPLNIDSEDILVDKLDEYLEKHNEKICEIIKKLRPAINNLRLPLVKGETIEKVKTAAYKNALLERAKQCVDIPNIRIASPKMKNPRQKVTLLSSLPVEMIGQLQTYFILEFQGTSYISNAQDKPILVEIYQRYQNSFLINTYSEEDLKTILEIYKKEALLKGDASPLKIFINYKDYLE